VGAADCLDWRLHRTNACRSKGVPDAFPIPSVPAFTGPISIIPFGAPAASAARFTLMPGIVLSSPTGPPTSIVTVSGTGFADAEGVDVFFDITEEALAGVDAAGNFGPISVTVPASATPGTHWISAEGRYSGRFVQATFTVETTWPQFRNQPPHHGYNGTENVLSPWAVSGMSLNWSFNFYGAGAPVVANGVVYVGCDDNNVYALDASTGTQLWSFTTGNPVNSTAVADGVVYVGSGDFNVYALDASTGAQLWSFNTGGWVFSSPAVANGVVYIGGTVNVYALDASTGAQLWSFVTGGEVESSPAVWNGVVYVGSDDCYLYALDASTGAELWRFYADSTGLGVWSSPAVANGLVYLGSLDNSVYAVNASAVDFTGADVWSFTTGGPVPSSPAVANGVVYIGSLDNNVYALDAFTGEELWSFTTGGEVWSSPAVANGVVYVGSNDNNVYALDAFTGEELWSFTTGWYVMDSPVVANGVVYVGSTDSNLYAFGLANANT
jgi:eukaryotic-like serine/threonine-protein kinase